MLAVVAAVLIISAPSAAQDWTEYQNIPDGFKINFPGQPTISESKWTTEFGYVLPARIYTANRGKERYTVTVVNYAPIQALGEAKIKTCPPGAEPCSGSELSGPSYWKHDVRGAIIYTTSKFLERNAKVTRFHWSHMDLVEGHQLQLTNADGSRTFAFIGMHDMKLYIIEGTVPVGSPEPGLFQQSLGWVDKDGNGIRYQTIYANQFNGLGDAPGTRGGGGGGRGRGAGAGGGGQGGGRQGGAPNPQ
jgi:hypothetical protein